MDDLKFEIKKSNGQIIPCEVIFTFEDNNINYVVYTDNKLDQDGDLNILSSRFEIQNDKVVLSNIETEEEYALVERKIAEIVGDQ